MLQTVTSKLCNHINFFFEKKRIVVGNINYLLIILYLIVKMMLLNLWDDNVCLFFMRKNRS